MKRRKNKVFFVKTGVSNVLTVLAGGSHLAGQSSMTADPPSATINCRQDSSHHTAILPTLLTT